MDAQEHIFDNDSPTSWTPKSSGIKKFTDIPPLELARQFTLLDHFLFSSIQPKECLKCAWSKKDQEKLAPNILGMINQFNRVSIITLV